MSNHSNTKTDISSKKALKVLFVASGNRCEITPVVRNQGNALVSDGVEVEYYQIRGKGFKGYMKNVRPLRKYLKEHKYDTIHAHYSLSAFVASLAGAKPLVVSLMGCDVNAAKWFKFIIRLFSICFRWKAIIVKSNKMYHALGMKNAVVIPNGVDLERFRPMDKAECQKRLGWRITNHKLQTTNDQSQTTNAIRHILFPAKASRPEKDYALAEAAVQITNHKLQTTNVHVVLHAFMNIPNEETPYWYNAVDVVLMTSLREGSPNAIKEAMACSRPIVTTDVGDVRERMHDLEGCYVAQSRDPQELASLIEKALAFTQTNGRERIIADQLDSKTISDMLIKIYGAK